MFYCGMIEEPNAIEYWVWCTMCKWWWPVCFLAFICLIFLLFLSFFLFKFLIETPDVYIRVFCIFKDVYFQFSQYYFTPILQTERIENVMKLICAMRPKRLTYLEIWVWFTLSWPNWKKVVSLVIKVKSFKAFLFPLLLRKKWSFNKNKVRWQPLKRFPATFVLPLNIEN